MKRLSPEEWRLIHRALIVAEIELRARAALLQDAKILARADAIDAVKWKVVDRLNR